MFETNSKFPKIFVYMMSILATIMCVGIFFSARLVGGAYFLAMLICAILFMLDRKYGSFLTNYKLTYLLFEAVNFIAVLSVIVYEYSKHTEVLNLFLILLIAIEVVMMIVDIFLIKNKQLDKSKNLIFDLVKLCSMVCIITYFFNVSKLYFAIFAFLFESINVFVKVMTYFENKNKAETVEPVQEKLEDIIHSGDGGDGE